MARQNQKATPKPAKSVPVKTLIKRDSTSYWLISGLALTVIVYLPSLFNGLVNWDDNGYIFNPYVNDLSPAGIVKIFSVYFLGNYHPLTLISLGIDRLIGGNSPFIYHFTNLLLHLLNTFMVFLLVKRLTKNNLLAILTFILFGVHTLHVESVAWIAERKDVLYSFFFLVSLTIYTIYASGRKGVYYGLSLLCFLLSLLAKGQAVVLVAILPFIDYVMDRKWSSVKVLSEKIPFFFLSLVFSWLAFRAQEAVSTLHFESFPLSERFAFASFGAVQYLIKSILPFNLSAFYPYPPKLADGSIPFFYWLFIISLPVLFIGSYFLFKRSKIYAFGISLFFISLLPLLQLIPVGEALMADRYFYIPSIGLLLCFAYCLLELKNTWIRYAVFIFFVLLFSSLSFLRCRVWKDSLTLWDDVISKYNYSSVAYSNRGYTYSNLGQTDKAIDDYSKAIELFPNYADGYYNRGIIYANLGQRDKAIDDYSKAIELNPTFPDEYYNRGIAYSNLGDWDKAISDYSKAIELNPKYAYAYNNRGVIYANIGQWDKAVADYSSAIGIEPNLSRAYSNRGIAYAKTEQWDKAIADDSRIIEIDPNYSAAYDNRGLVYASLGQWEKAIADYNTAIGIDPQHTNAYFDRGVTYASLGQWDKAIADYTLAIKVNPNRAKNFYNRGIAYANLGQFENAIIDYTLAIEINSNYSDAFYNRGVAHDKLGQRDKAITDYKRAREIDPDYTKPNGNIQNAFKKMRGTKK
jgi:tetratricopeptide (TPR) repeat protein